MKSMITLASVVAVVTLSTTVHAEPPPAVGYLQLDGMGGTLLTGASSGATYGGLAVDAGYRLGATPLWARGMVGVGGISPLSSFGGNDALLVQGRVGLEARTCSRGGGACVVGGVDLGVLNAHDSVTSVSGFGDNGTNSHTDMTYSLTAFEVVPRAGLDLGNRTFRVRPAVELPFATGGIGVGIAATVGLAVLW